MKKIFSIVFILGWLLLASGCGSQSKALFSDNFSSTNSGWTQFQDKTGLMDYDNGRFRILVNDPNILLIATPGQSFGDVRIDVKAVKVGGPDDNYFGVVCRYQDPNNYYLFLISSDGYSGIAMRKAGDFSLISPGEKFIKMEGINLGTATNHIQVNCAGDQLVLFANGKQVSMAYDKSFTSGDVGLAARSNSTEGGVDILFDNFNVYSAAPQQP